ncbi:hypothetical protein SMALA_3882 [Streptomyces malaysiensis subsp. malaysiensis]|nr:hypothetical protein SMALA_3882 [Streptomyces malaysiensis]
MSPGGLPHRPRARPSLVVSRSSVVVALCVHEMVTMPAVTKCCGRLHKIVTQWWYASGVESPGRTATYPVLLCRTPTMTAEPRSRPTRSARSSAAPWANSCGYLPLPTILPAVSSRRVSAWLWSAARYGTRCSAGLVTIWISPRMPGRTRY